ncbi:hypothetical protein EXIGLDRAFT_333664 [Exidia glandulosa HHB12029]|uniref:Rsm22-domain-containing protein n=1 Tax=Exidia glandulosa HHB12029 TaxID=1314781 RepID=A0A165CPB2_EXIGL|nr:hypothetical protein EXIGLDRAFT_333664 [Exidia glandulosa HHB12029]
MSLRALSRATTRSFSACASRHAAQPHSERIKSERDRVQRTPYPTMENDPSLYLLLRDVDNALKGPKGREMRKSAPASDQYPFLVRVKPAQFDAVDPTDEYGDFEELDEGGPLDRERKAPAAYMGGVKAKTITLPLPLIIQMEEIVEEADKRQLRSDAKRIYERASPQEDEPQWSADDPEYKSRKQALERSHRDGLAYAAVVMPQHYSSIYNVFKQMDLRFGDALKKTNIVDIGCHSGEALWAARTVWTEDDVLGVKNYFGIDPRPKMIQMGNRLTKDIDLYGCNASFHYKLTQALPSGLTPEMAAETMIINAFDLSRHARWRDRRDRLHEMWQTGAATIVLIEEGTREGYEFIAEAREYLLRLGAVEVQDAKYQPAEERPFWTPGSHVAMPCPHDRPCAMLPDLKSACSFGQTFDPPSFSRDTKHISGAYHDRVSHAYVVFRRGPRPDDPGTSYGRVGLVGRREEERLRSKRVTAMEETEDQVFEAVKEEAVVSEHAPDPAMETDELKDALRKEAMFWPRLNMPPLKKAGHIVMDACTRDGSVQRLTISRSRGKQEFYDARKSSWGDSFPHEPTIPPVMRFRSLHRQKNFDPDESALAELELIRDYKRKKETGGRNKWNDDKERNRKHEERRLIRKEGFR